MNTKCRGVLQAALVLSTTGCFSTPLPTEAPPLADMEEPLHLFAEPDDETERQALDAGAFTGVYAAATRRSLEDLLGEGEGVGVEVERIVENSPADLAGLRPQDLLLEARIDGGEPVALEHASQWRKVELGAKPGRELRVAYDRAGSERQATIVPVRRLRAPGRREVERFREEQRAGVVFRTATEVEARRATLGPGGGAVVVGLSRASPWRQAGVRFEDVIAAIDGRAIDDPQVVLEVMRTTQRDRVSLQIQRGDARLELEAPLTHRAAGLDSFEIPLLFSHESNRGHSETSFLLGLFGHESTAAAWRVRLLWLITFGGGDRDELVEVDTVGEDRR